MSNPPKSSPAAKILNLFLLVSFLLTLCAPLTGIIIHKLASAVFLLLCLIHTLIHRKRLKWRGGLILLLVLAAFVSGLLSLIFGQFPLVLALHKMLSIGTACILAIHIFVYHRRLR